MKLQPGRIPAISLTWATSMTYLTLAGREFSMSQVPSLLSALRSYHLIHHCHCEYDFCMSVTALSTVLLYCYLIATMSVETLDTLHTI